MSVVNFLVETEVTVDAKGRFLLPASVRKQLPEGVKELVVKKGMEPCVTIYTKNVWDILYDKVSKLNDFKEEVRRFKRMFLSGANVVEPDTADRVLITKALLEYAGITKDAVLTGQGNKLELWDKDKYYKYQEQHAGGYSDLADSVAGDIGNPFDGI